MAKTASRKKPAAKRINKPKLPTVKVQSEIPVVADVDVVVAGAGIAGCMTALAAARNGAKTILIDRFAGLGGNMGPGLWGGGVVHFALSNVDAMPNGLKGLPGEFLNRCAGHVSGQLGYNYFEDSQVTSHVWLRFMEENNVRLMLNTKASDPLMDGKKIIGLTVDGRSGRQAVRAKVVVDATGYADIAARAGAPTDEGKAGFHPGMFFAIGGVDVPRYKEVLDTYPPPEPRLQKWCDETFKKHGSRMNRWRFHPLLHLIKKAWDFGEYRIIRRIEDLATITMDHGLHIGKDQPYGQPLTGPFRAGGCPDAKDGIVGSMTGLYANNFDWDDAAIHTRLEVGCRLYIFETAQFLKHHFPGFEASYLHITSQYFHDRLGRSAICDYVLTEEDATKGTRFNDVVYRTYALNKSVSHNDKGVDWPYRQFLPKGLDGMLMAGRAACSGPTVNRNRYKMLLMGQVVGIAAALAARDNVSPRKIDVKELQRILVHKYHVPMEDDPKRLAGLGL